MQVKHIVAAVAAALIAPAAMAASLTATNVIYVGGATAQTPGLAKSAQAFCSGTFNTYSDNVDGKSGFVYTCSSANTTKSGLTGSFIIVKNEGGSSQGVSPVVNKTNIAFPDITNCTTSSTPIAGSNTSDIINFNGTCAYNASTLNAIPQLGLTDVPSKIWKARGQFTPSTTAYTTKANFAGQGFGVAVSSALYTALQQDQVNAGFLGASCVGDTSVACQPSISKEQYAAIATFNPASEYQVDWSSLLNHSTLGATNMPAATDVVSLCRRSSGSGTQASSDIYFMNSPCEAGTALQGAATPVGAGVYDANGTISTDTTGATTGVPYTGTPAFVVTEGGSTGVAKTCLLGSTGNALVPTANYAVGVLSLENVQPASGWKFVKVNGASPNVEATQKKTIVDGSYDFAYETELLYRNDAPTNVQTFGNKLVAELGNGNNLTTFPGLYADPTSGSAFVTGQTHKGSRGGNVCAVHQLQF